MSYYQQLPAGHYPPPPPNAQQQPMYGGLSPPNVQSFQPPQQQHPQHPPQGPPLQSSPLPSPQSAATKSNPAFHADHSHFRPSSYGATSMADQSLNDVPLNNPTSQNSSQQVSSSYGPPPVNQQQFAQPPPSQQHSYQQQSSANAFASPTGPVYSQSYAGGVQPTDDVAASMNNLSLNQSHTNVQQKSSVVTQQQLASNVAAPAQYQVTNTGYTQPDPVSLNASTGYAQHPPPPAGPPIDANRQSNSYLTKNRYPPVNYSQQPPAPQAGAPPQAPQTMVGNYGPPSANIPGAPLQAPQPMVGNYGPPSANMPGQFPVPPTAAGNYGAPPASAYQPGLPAQGHYGGQQAPPLIDGYMRQSSGPPHPQIHHQQQPQQARQLDPDSIPSVVQVLEEDRAKWANDKKYDSGIPCAMPPLYSTIHDLLGQRLQTNDYGSARPQYMRSSLYNIPINEDLLKITGIPFNVIIQPFDQLELETDPNSGRPAISIPVTDSEIVRCNRCKAYMSPFMRFTDGGKRFQCAMCHQISEVTNEFFAHLDHTGQRLDKYERPELHLGSYEYRANAEFYRNSLQIPRRPHIIFAFELTQSSRPLIAQLSAHLGEVIRSSLPVDPANHQLPLPMVGFVGYNSKIHLFDVGNGGIAHVICDVAGTFPPFTNFLVDPLQQMDKIDEFLERLPALFVEQELETESILGPVVEAALQTCQADNGNWFGASPPAKDADKVIPVGKIYLFHCTLPTYGQDGVTPGRLKQRWTSSNEEVRRLLGTEKEKQILTPEPSKYYSQLGQRCVSDYGSGVELFLFPPVNGSYVDVATISELCRLTGTGAVHKYYNDYSTRFVSDLRDSLRSTMAFDVVFKVRSSTGLRPVDYVGHFYSRSVNDIECAALNSGCSISVEFKYDDKLAEDEFVLVQAVALYTSVGGDRRIRIHNLVLPICNQVADIYKNASCDTLVNHLLRTSVTQLRLGEKTVQQVKEGLINRAVTILTTYRKHCAQPGSTLGQLILPEALKLLPVYLTGLLKVDAIDGGPEMVPDDKAYAQIRTLGANVDLSQAIIYPRLLRFEYDEQQQLQCTQIRCSFQRLGNPAGLAYILENGFYLFLYVPALPENPSYSSFLRNVFGTGTVQQVDPEKDLPLLDNPDSQYLHNVISEIHRLRRKAMKVYIVRQNLDKNEVIFKCFLYEDKKPLFAGSTGDGKFEAPSYVDLLCHLHKEIRAQMN